MNIFVLDACAMIALLSEEEGCDVVEELIQQAIYGNIKLKINQINLLEVYYDLLKVRNQIYANQIIEIVKEYPIDFIHGLSDNVFQEAGRLKANYKIPLGDAIAMAECIVQNATLVTSDRKDIEKVEKAENVKVNWFR